MPSAGETTVALMHRLERDGHIWDNWAVQAPRKADGLMIQWTMGVYWPSPHSHGAVLLSPDACWPHCMNEMAAREAERAGVALAWFNRLELAYDPPDTRRVGPVFEGWPEYPFGAVAAWAWGLQRCVDALLLTGLALPGCIGVIGHSRGGKAALLAGATDPRIAATIAHNSGTGGGSSFQVVGEGSESLAALAARFPHWLGPRATDAKTQQHITEIDNLPLLRAIAPRGLYLMQAGDDAWANPPGTQYAFEQLQPAWAALGRQHCIDWQERTGGHPMTGLDWQRAAAFLQRVVAGESTGKAHS